MERDLRSPELGTLKRLDVSKVSNRLDQSIETTDRDKMTSRYRLKK